MPCSRAADGRRLPAPPFSAAHCLLPKVPNGWSRKVPSISSIRSPCSQRSNPKSSCACSVLKFECALWSRCRFRHSVSTQCHRQPTTTMTPQLSVDAFDILWVSSVCALSPSFPLIHSLSLSHSNSVCGGLVHLVVCGVTVFWYFVCVGMWVVLRRPSEDVVFQSVYSLAVLVPFSLSLWEGAPFVFSYFLTTYFLIFLIGRLLSLFYDAAFIRTCDRILFSFSCGNCDRL